MATSIELIQGDFWTSSGSEVTVPFLLKRLNEGNAGKEWVPGWNGLESDHKKYIAATVSYRLYNQTFPKKYEDIEPYLK